MRAIWGAVAGVAAISIICEPIGDPKPLFGGRNCLLAYALAALYWALGGMSEDRIRRPMARTRAGV